MNSGLRDEDSHLFRAGWEEKKWEKVETAKVSHWMFFEKGNEEVEAGRSGVKGEIIWFFKRELLGYACEQRE